MLPFISVEPDEPGLLAFEGHRCPEVRPEATGIEREKVDAVDGTLHPYVFSNGLFLLLLNEFPLVHSFVLLACLSVRPSVHSSIIGRSAAWRTPHRSVSQSIG